MIEYISVVSYESNGEKVTLTGRRPSPISKSFGAKLVAAGIVKLNDDGTCWYCGPVRARLKDGTIVDVPDSGLIDAPSGKVSNMDRFSEFSQGGKQDAKP